MRKKDKERLIEQEISFSFTLQWHLTNKCTKHCKHRYLYDAKGNPFEITQELSFNEQLKIIEDLANFARKQKVPARINFTGGDPLLHLDLFNLIKYAQEFGIMIGILGNPDLLTKENLNTLTKLHIQYYQINLDGLEKNHDFIRGEGDFKKTVQGLDKLKEAKIPSAVMFTLTKLNRKDLFSIINLVVKKEVSFFDFRRIVPTNFNPSLMKMMLAPAEFKTILQKVFLKYKEMKQKGMKTCFERGDPLWFLFYKENRLLDISWVRDKNIIYSGCAIGISELGVLPDGSVYACRRLPIFIGKFPEQTIEEVFINSQELNKMRDVSKIEKCTECELNQFCRGCRAIAYATTGSVYAPDPQCWKE